MVVVVETRPGAGGVYACTEAETYLDSRNVRIRGEWLAHAHKFIKHG